MRLKQILSVAPVIILVLLSVVAGAACSSGGGGMTSAVDTMEQLPRGGDGFAFADLEEMQGNEQLKDLYDSYSDEVVADMEEESGISPDDVSAVAISVSLGGEVVAIIKGTFDLNDIRDKLEDQEFDEDEYKDVETWESSDDYSQGAVALMSDSLIIVGYTMSDVEDCIDVIKGEGSSLDENEDLKDMMGRLPAGMAVGCLEVPSIYKSQLGNSDYSYLEGVDLVGLSLGVQDEDLLLTVVLKFESESDADDAYDEIQDDIEDAIDDDLEDYLDPDDVEINVTQDNEYLTVTAEMSIETLAGVVEGLSESSNVEAARSELATAQTAVEAYMAECEIGRLNASDLWTSTWDGSANAAAFAICTDHDPADLLVDGEFRAIYTVNCWGEIISGTTAGATNPWPADVTWDQTLMTWE